MLSTRIPACPHMSSARSSCVASQPPILVIGPQAWFWRLAGLCACPYLRPASALILSDRCDPPKGKRLIVFDNEPTALGRIAAAACLCALMWALRGTRTKCQKSILWTFAAAEMAEIDCVNLPSMQVAGSRFQFRPVMEIGEMDSKCEPPPARMMEAQRSAHIRAALASHRGRSQVACSVGTTSISDCGW